MPPQKKPRTPQPPRVQAPQVRAGSKSPAELEARHRAILYALAGSGVVALIVVVALVAFGGGTPSGKKVGKLMTAAGCTFSSNKISVPGGKTHIARLTGKFPWATNPPDGGAHYPLWSVWGFYTQPVNPRMVVHNMEHGGVILWWGTQTPQATVSDLKALYDEQTTGVLGTPYANFGSRIAITAWTGNSTTYQHGGDYGQGHIAVCLHWNAATKKAFEAFRDTYRGHGPEGVPLSADAVGMGPS
jgi:hypothetical protein